MTVAISHIRETCDYPLNIRLMMQASAGEIIGIALRNVSVRDLHRGCVIGISSSPPVAGVYMNITRSSSEPMSNHIFDVHSAEFQSSVVADRGQAP
jgi:selenocysteine-specific translation elongation factor